jgi:Outer membrane protein beta-barrel domain
MHTASRATMLSLIVLLSLAAGASAQQSEASKIEIGAQFTSLTRFPPRASVAELSAAAEEKQTEPGFGLRFTYNLTNNFALEAEGNFFPHRNLQQRSTGGRAFQGQFGLKAGKRFERFGIFAKACPGFVSYGEVLSHVGEATVEFNGQQFTFFELQPERRTYFSMDLGAALEFYPSRRIVARFDAGDTIIRQGRTPDSGPVLFEPTPARTMHNFQFSAGLALRLLAPRKDDSEAQTPRKKDAPRFELGAQFSSLSLNSVERPFGVGIVIFPNGGAEFHDTQAEPGFGGRFTYNLTQHVALEAENNFFPHEHRQINSGRGGGRALQGQFGAKVGRRFNTFGIFAKARPGFISFSKTVKFDGFETLSFGGGPPIMIPLFRLDRQTYFSLDLGGVLEFYPSRRIVTRFDAGDTLIRYSSSTVAASGVASIVSLSEVLPETRHNFQFSAGIGFRF